MNVKADCDCEREAYIANSMAGVLKADSDCCKRAEGKYDWLVSDWPSDEETSRV